jgi:hypothetical protein
MKEDSTILGSIYERFVQETPAAVMVRAVLERCLGPQTINELFEQHAQGQYTRTLLFSTVFTLLCETVCGVHGSVHAAYQSRDREVGTSVVALYDKLKATEPAIVAALVSHTARELGPVLEQMGGARPSPLPGWRVRILDGSWLESTEHRLKVLRSLKDAPLPGKALVVLDPALLLVQAVVPCEDGHAQERALLPQAAELVQRGELWLGDRNLCTLGWVEQIEARGSGFVARQHAGFPVEPLEEFRVVGRSPTGLVSEQRVRVRLPHQGVREWRRVRVQLDQPTRNGEREILLITNLPANTADALQVAELYRGRWTIERVFQEIALALNCEINTLAYPRAALFGLCVGLVAYNALAVAQAALRAAHGALTVEQEISGYYLAQEFKNTNRGLDVAMPERVWVQFRQMSPQAFAMELVRIAKQTTLRKYKKHPRGPKKQPPTRRWLGKGKGSHVSTARLLLAAKGKSK